MVLGPTRNQDKAIIGEGQSEQDRVVVWPGHGHPVGSVRRNPQLPPTASQESPVAIDNAPKPVASSRNLGRPVAPISRGGDRAVLANRHKKSFPKGYSVECGSVGHAVDSGVPR